MENDPANSTPSGDPTAGNSATGNSATGYTVVARRYRPKNFDELIGQNHIAQTLGKAISTGRVGHAYLFTGARGVGKTSTARIFAKVLNTRECNDPQLVEDISQAIDAGEDMDVIEIDGASNRGIEEIRQLRANVNVRPSRSNFKIYIIDEVHMLTNQAFNALLKTLEEPPAHVKFIFCTTDPDKIPITVLSRCQRFDFAPVAFEDIQRRLQEICQKEGFSADDEAIGLLARRAAGSMRDSQSLLEQVMSFSAEHITLDQVHALLGTADEGQLLAIAEKLAEHDALGAVQLVDEATKAGADPGQLAEQLLNYFRDLMTTSLGGGPGVLKLASPAGHAELAALAGRLGTQTILSAIQIIDESLVRMRASVSSVTLLEVALVQICQLEHLASIPELLERVAQESQGQAPARPASRPADEKKNEQPVNSVAGSVVASQQHNSGSDQTSVPPVSASSSQGSGAAVGSVNSPASEVPGNYNGQPTPSQPVSHVAETQDNTAQDNGVQVNVTQPTVSPADNPQETAAANQQSAQQAASEPVAGASNAEVAKTPDSSPSSTQAPVSAPQTTAQAASHSSEPNSSSNAVTPQESAGTPSPNAGSGSKESLQIWKRAAGSIDGMLADFAGLAVAVEPVDSQAWRVVFPPGAQTTCQYCEQPERKSSLQAALRSTVGRDISLSFAVMPGEARKPVAKAPQSSLRAQKMREMSEHPYVKKVCEILEGEIVRVDPPKNAPPKSNNNPAHKTNA